MSVVRNTGYNLAATLVPALIGLLTVPPYIHAMGEARYGVIALLGSLLGYFGVIDLGIGAAVTQRVAAIDPADRSGRHRTIWTAILLNLGLGLLGTVAVIPVARWAMGGAFQVPGSLLGEVRDALGWLALAFPVILLSGVLRGVLIGAGRFRQLNTASLAMSVASQVIPLGVALWVDQRLVAVLPAIYATRLGLLAWYLAIIVREVAGSGVPRFDRSIARGLLSYGGWMTLSGLVAPLLTTLDRMLIGSQLGVRAVSHYTVPAQLAERFLIVPAALLQALFPRMVAGDGTGEANLLAVKAQRAIFAVMTAPMAAAVIFLRPFLAFWIGPDFAAQAALPGQLLLCGLWWNGFGMISADLLQAQGRPRLIALTHAIEIVPYAAGLIAGLAFFGLPGAALAYSMRIIADDLVLAAFAGLMSEMVSITARGLAVFGAALWLGTRGADLLSLTSLAGLGLVAVLATLSLNEISGFRESIALAFRLRAIR